MNLVTFRLLKLLNEANGPVRRAVLTANVLSHMTTTKRQRVLRAAERAGWISEDEARRLNGAGPPAREYTITEKGRHAYNEAAAHHRDGIYRSA